jgi:hypothetical protein
LSEINAHSAGTKYPGSLSDAGINWEKKIELENQPVYIARMVSLGKVFSSICSVSGHSSSYLFEARFERNLPSGRGALNIRSGISEEEIWAEYDYQSHTEKGVVLSADHNMWKCDLTSQLVDATRIDMQQFCNTIVQRIMEDSPLFGNEWVDEFKTLRGVGKNRKIVFA